MSNSQSRKWALTINNPLESGLDHKAIIDILMLFFPDYFCGSDEIATTGTYHTHLFIYSQSPVRFTTLKKRFPTSHIEKALGSASQNRDYILKGGKWAEGDKAETSVEGSFFEYGVLPQEGKEQGSKMAVLIDNIKDGKRTAQIVEDLPSLGFRVRDIDVLRQTLLSERYSIENRNLEVIYIYGMTGAGKTRGIYERHSPRDICRITDYGKNGVRFDSYNGQEVLVFEEFSSQIPIEDMLNYLDLYPLNLPARYNDRVACYLVVYFTSNIPLLAQYKDVQIYRPETWRAFLRRIRKVIEYKPDGTTVETVLNDRKEITNDRNKSE